MKFLLDQDVYQVTVDFLKSLGYETLRAKKAGLAKALDEELLQYAYQNGYVLVTRDKGFGALIFLKVHKHKGVILLRMDPRTADYVHQELARLFEKHTEAEFHNCFVVVEPARHRLRKS